MYLISDKQRPASWPRPVIALSATLSICWGALAGSPEERPFLAENKVAMDKMMADMDARPTGDVDRDFVFMMVPHHQGAIEMAQSELRYGHNETLRRIAQEIIVGQQQEIVAMHLALGQPLAPSTAAPDQPSDLTDSGAQKMSMPKMNMKKEP
jgi:hypothetical protein